MPMDAYWVVGDDFESSSDFTLSKFTVRRTAQTMAVLSSRSCSLRSQAKSPRQCVEDVHLSGPDALNMTRSSIGAG